MRKAKFTFKKLRNNDIYVIDFMKKSKLAYNSLKKLDAGEPVTERTMNKAYAGMQKMGIAR